jgi:hypothetical protein
MNKMQDFICRKCSHAVTKWTEMGPRGVHAYGVNCLRCGTFIKWGTKDELRQLTKAGNKFKLLRYVQAPPRATLKGYME